MSVIILLRAIINYGREEFSGTENELSGVVISALCRVHFYLC